jgi:hypothetical protein
MPLPPAEVRRRGDRLRRRSNVLRTGAAALAVAAVVVPLALRADHDRDDRGYASDPQVQVPGVGETNVLADAETTYAEGYHWQQTSSEAGDGPSGPIGGSVCTTRTLGQLGATSVYRRAWVLADDAGPLQGTGAADRLAEAVAGYPSPEAARAAVDDIAAAIAQCGPRMAPQQHYSAQRPRTVDTGDPDDTAMLVESNFLAAPYRDEDGRFVETGLVASGDRVAVLTLEVGGQDFTIDPTPVEQMLPAAAHRLAGSPAAQARTTIPAGFPLDTGWSDDQPEGADSRVPPSRTRPVPELTACGTTLRWPRYVDRMSAGFHNPEDARDATLTTYADTDAAAAATRAIADLYRACPAEPTQPDGYVLHTRVTRTATSTDSWLASAYYTYNGKPAIGLSDLEVIHVGRAVLVLAHNNEGGEDSIAADVRSMEREASDAIAAMCVFTDDGC